MTNEELLAKSTALMALQNFNDKHGRYPNATVLVKKAMYFLVRELSEAITGQESQ